MESNRTRRWMRRPFKRREKKRRLLPRWSLLFVLLWLGGFAVFAAFAKNQAVSSVPQGRVYDVAVVLTGGPGRLQAAADLLRRNRVRQVLISGVHRDVTLSDLKKMLSLPDTLANCCLLIDKRAKNTWHNAEESVHWVKSVEAKSVVLVTADYHVPRSAYLFRHELERQGVTGVSLLPLGVDGGGSVGHLFVEYHKYLTSLVLHLRWSI